MRLNLALFELILSGEVSKVDVLAPIGCKVSSLPTSYLGLPLGSSFMAKAVSHGVKDRFQRLEGWKRQY